MNFTNMPELRWYSGYFACLALVITVCTSMYAGFRRAGWL